MKQLFSVFFKFYIQSSLHVSLAIVSLFLVFAKVNEFLVDWNFVGFLFFCNITGYNFVKYASIAKLHHRSLTNSLKSIQVFSLLSFFILAYFTFQLKLISLVIVSVIGLLTFLYATPLGNLKNFRSISGLKIFIVAFCWAISVVILPVINYNFPFNWKILLHFLQVFVFVVSLIIPFDIRDLKYDDKKLNTLPQKFGILGAKLFGIMLMVTFLGIEVSVLKTGNYIPVSTISILTIILIVISPKPQIKYYCSFWVESLPVVYFLCTSLVF